MTSKLLNWSIISFLYITDYIHIVIIVQLHISYQHRAICLHSIKLRPIQVIQVSQPSQVPFLHLVGKFNVTCHQQTQILLRLRGLIINDSQSSRNVTVVNWLREVPSQTTWPATEDTKVWMSTHVTLKDQLTVCIPWLVDAVLWNISPWRHTAHHLILTYNYCRNG